MLHPGRQEMKEETPRECATGEVPHPLLASANILQPVPTSKVPTEEQTLPSHLPCALQGPLLLPRPCAGDTDVPAEGDRLTGTDEASAPCSSSQEASHGGQNALFKNWHVLWSLLTSTCHFWLCF